MTSQIRSHKAHLAARIRRPRAAPTVFVLGLLLAAVAAPQVLAASAEATSPVSAKEAPKEVRVGAYVMSLYDLNANNNTFAADFWLWAVHDKRYDIKPLKTMEPDNARTFATSLDTTEEHELVRYHAQKVRGVFSYNWNVENFPFDRHELRISLSEGQDEVSALTYTADAANTGIEPSVEVEGWKIDAVKIQTGTHSFSSTFGEPGSAPTSTYAQAVVSIFVSRRAMGLFLKLHSAVYIAFLIGMISFFLDTSKDGLFGGRISLLVGMIFATVLNTQRIATALGQTDAFTLPDKIHVLTLGALLCALIGSLVSRRLHVRDQAEHAYRVDWWMGAGLFVTYVLANILLIAHAAHAG